MLWSGCYWISYFHLFQIRKTINTQCYVREDVVPEAFPLLQRILGFSMTMPAHMLGIYKPSSVHYMLGFSHSYLLPVYVDHWTCLRSYRLATYLYRRSGTEYDWTLVSGKVYLECLFPSVIIQNLYDSMPRHLQDIIVVRLNFIRFWWFLHGITVFKNSSLCTA